MVASMPNASGNPIGLSREQGNSRKVMMDACDGFALPDGGGAMVVLADGMGGYTGGEVASRLAVDTALEIFHDHGFLDVRATVGLVFQVVQERIQRQQQADPTYARMGTTMVVAALQGYSLVVGHVGDSRATLFRGTRLKRLTKDHLVVVEREGADDAGVKSDPRFASKANVLSRYLGGANAVPDFATEGVEAGDWIVLASDGITEFVHEDRISRVLRKVEPGEAARQIVHDAIANRSHDHCSVAILRVP